MKKIELDTFMHFRMLSSLTFSPDGGKLAYVLTGIDREKDEIYPRDAFLHNLSHPGVLQLGAFENEQLVGVVRASLWEESGMVKDIKTVCLDNIYVLPAWRRKGIAAKLFTEVELWAKEQGAFRLDLHVWDFNKNAIAMYQALGMTPQRYVFEKKL